MTLCPHCGQPMPEPTPYTRPLPSEKEFHEWFWPQYPHRVGKQAALYAWVKARKKASMAQILEGLGEYKSKKPPSTPWCNPATWLNQERWLDQPAYVDTTQKPEPPKQDGFEIWRVRIRNYLKDGSWPQIAPPLEQCPWQVRAEFEEQLEAKRKASYAKQTDEMFGSDI